uniref:ATP-binding protein n=1 Tax=Campylobacter fetus TaxID=196 RepID=UPI003AF966E2
MQNIIINQNKHWSEPYKNLYDRQVMPKLINSLKLRHIMVLQGIRRSGKSTVFKLLINHLSKSVDSKEILYINLDDPFFSTKSKDARVINDIVSFSQRLTNKRVKYLFLDEISAVNNWEKYVKSAYDSELFDKIFITGSNSALLNTQYATLLSGRYLSTQIYPLSFKEILKINNINDYFELIKEKNHVLNLVQDMAKFGSFVEVYESNSEFKRDIISSYYDAILLKDCVANNQIRDIAGFRELGFYSLTNFGALYSYNSLSNAVKLNPKSVQEYIGYLQECYLCDELKMFSYSLKEQMNNKKKLYLCDNGFLSLAFSFSDNKGRALENLVFCELKKLGFELFFYKTNDSECDFIARKNDKSIALQVCYELNEKNIKREIAGLNKLPFGVNEKYLITFDDRWETELSQFNLRDLGLNLDNYKHRDFPGCDENSETREKSNEKKLKIMPFYEFFSEFNKTTNLAL